MKRITENWTDALRCMEVGEVAEFPLENEPSITGSIIPRMRKVMWKEKADWKRVGEYDYDNGFFFVKRIS